MLKKNNTYKEIVKLNKMLNDKRKEMKNTNNSNERQKLSEEFLNLQKKYIDLKSGHRSIYNIGDVLNFYVGVPDGKHMFEAGHSKTYVSILDTGIVVGEFKKDSKSNFRGFVWSFRNKTNAFYVNTRINQVLQRELPIEYKLCLVGKFGSWWTKRFKNIFQSYVIEALNERKALDLIFPDDVWNIIKAYMFCVKKNTLKYMIINLDYYFYNLDRTRLLDKIKLNNIFIDNKKYSKYGFNQPVDVPDKLLLFVLKNLPINIYINKISNEKNVVVSYIGKKLENFIEKENRLAKRGSSSEEEWQEQKIPGIILKTKVSRPSITKLFYMYFDLKNLRLEKDRRIIIPDKNLRELFGEALEDGENITFTNFQTKLKTLIYY